MKLEAGLSWVAPRTKAFVPTRDERFFVAGNRGHRYHALPTMMIVRDVAHSAGRKELEMERFPDAAEEDAAEDAEYGTPQIFIHQVEDHSLPALEILAEQRADQASDDAPRAFVP